MNNKPQVVNLHFSEEKFIILCDMLRTCLAPTNEAFVIREQLYTIEKSLKGEN